MNIRCKTVCWTLITFGAICLSFDLCFAKKAHLSGHTQETKKAAKTILKDGPPIGLYEVKVFNPEWVQDGETEYFQWFQWGHGLKWLRLYKNGTYKTNLSKTGKPEGRISYNHTKREVTFYVFHPKESDEENIIYNKTPTDYGYGYATETKGPIICWEHHHYTASAHGGGWVECKWVKP